MIAGRGKPSRAVLALAAVVLAAGAEVGGLGGGPAELSRPGAVSAADELVTTKGPEKKEPEKKSKDEEMTTPPPEPLTESPVSILGSVCSTILQELHGSRYQAINAFVAIIFGMLMVLDGESVFRWLVIGIIGIVACIMAKNEATMLWDLDPRSAIGDVAGIEVGLLVGYAAYIGVEGVMLMLGALFGTLFAEWLRFTFVSHGLMFIEERWVLLTVFTALAALGICMFHRKGHLTSLAVLAPLIGGALVASATWFAMTDLATTKLKGWFEAHNLHPVGGHWVTFLEMLVGSPKPVGLFVGSPHNNTFLGERWPLDRVLCFLLWMILFACGAVMQFRKEMQRKTMSRNEQLAEPLLNA